MNVMIIFSGGAGSHGREFNKRSGLAMGSYIYIFCPLAFLPDRHGCSRGAVVALRAPSVSPLAKVRIPASLLCTNLH